MSLGPAFLSGNAWYGKNTGSLFGHVIQSQAPGQPDVTGFGAWGQLGVGLSSKLSLWAYAGIDKPNEDEARAAGFLLLQNSQLAGMLSYVDGPVVIALEYLRITTQVGLPGAAATPTTPATAPSSLTFGQLLLLSHVTVRAAYRRVRHIIAIFAAVELRRELEPADWGAMDEFAVKVKLAA